MREEQRVRFSKLLLSEKGTGINGISPWKTVDLGPTSCRAQKINLRWIVSLNLKARIKKLPEENIREYLCYLRKEGDLGRKCKEH